MNTEVFLLSSKVQSIYSLISVGGEQIYTKGITQQV